MTSDAGQDCEWEEKAVAVKEASILQAEKTDAVPRFSRNTDSPDEKSEGNSGNLVNNKIAIDNNFQLLVNSVPKTELKHANSNEELQNNMSDSQSDPQSCENTSVKYHKPFHIGKTYPKYQHINKYIATGNIIEYCKGAAKRLSSVINWIKENGHTELFLRDFAHSASCEKINCNPFCNMFKKLRKHVNFTKHTCSLLRLYSLILRLHVNSCKNTNCGLKACPILKLRQQAKREALNKTKAIKNRPCTSHIVQSGREPFLIPRILTSNIGRQAIIFFAKPIYRINIPLLNPETLKSVE